MIDADPKKISMIFYLNRIELGRFLIILLMKDLLAINAFKLESCLETKYALGTRTYC